MSDFDVGAAHLFRRNGASKELGRDFYVRVVDKHCMENVERSSTVCFCPSEKRDRRICPF